MPFSKPKFEPAPPRKNKYPKGANMKKGSQLSCMGCNNGKVAGGKDCKGCKGTGFIKV